MRESLSVFVRVSVICARLISSLYVRGEFECVCALSYVYVRGEFECVCARLKYMCASHK